MDKIITPLINANNTTVDEIERITGLIENDLVSSHRMENTEEYLNNLQNTLLHIKKALEKALELIK